MLTENHKGSKSVYLRTLLYFRAFTGQTLLAVVLMSAGIGLNLLKPWPFKYIVDGLLPGDAAHGSIEAKAFVAKWLGWTNPPGAVLALCGALVVISLLSSLINLISNALLIRIGLKALLHLRRRNSTAAYRRCPSGFMMHAAPATPLSESLTTRRRSRRSTTKGLQRPLGPSLL